VTAIVTRGDAANLLLPDESVDLIVTSPPYFGLRSYQDGGEHYAGQVGDEATPTEYLDALIACTREWVRVLKPGGSIFVNLGDKYSSASGPKAGGRPAGLVNGHNTDRWVDVPRGRAAAGAPAKSLLLLPQRYAIRCTDELGLILRAEIVWAKPNGLPESVTDRVRRSHEQVFHLTKAPRYYAAVDEVREAHAASSLQRFGHAYKNQSSEEAGRRWTTETVTANPLGKLPGSVWTIPTAPLSVPASLGVDHFAAYPPELVRRIVLGWSPRDVCTACGQGRRPLTQHLGYRIEGGVNNGTDPSTTKHGTGGATLGMVGRRVVTGYACACPAPMVTRTVTAFDYEADGMVTRDEQVPDPDWINPAPTTPGVVLDPFGGTGTTALVASCYGRVGISVDLSADYCRLARWRTTDPGQRASILQVPKPEKPVEGQLGLFEGLGA
jgi:DNA modification methylase